MTDLAGMAGHDERMGTSSSASGSDRPKRRTFTAEYKLATLEEYDQADADGALKALEPRTRKPGRSPAEIENEKLRKEKEKLTKELAQTKAALEIVGKAHALLEMLTESADSDDKSKKYSIEFRRSQRPSGSSTESPVLHAGASSSISSVWRKSSGRTACS